MESFVVDKKLAFQVRAVRRLGSNVRCAGCSNWATVLIWFRRLNMDIPLCGTCSGYLSSRLTPLSRPGVTGIQSAVGKSRIGSDDRIQDP